MAAMLLAILVGAGRAADETPAWKKAILDGRIKAFCVDFNWGPGGPNGFAKPGLWADADPARHVAWYEKLGVNVIQTFAVSCNGYAWYKGGVVPEQPGLKHDFLPEMVKLGHAKKMLVMGYYCIGSNTLWGQAHPDLSYGIPSTRHIPFTDEYLDDLTASIDDPLRKTGMDGFMVDWLFQPNRGATNGKWLDCEKKLYQQLVGHAFPGEDTLTKEQEIAYGRIALERAWRTIRCAAKETDPNCLIWLSTFQPLHPHTVDSQMYREIDWMMNEAGDIASVKAMMPMVGKHTRMMICLAAWNLKNPTVVVPAAIKEGIGLYGFGMPGTNSLLALPNMTNSVRTLKGNEKNVAALSRAYWGLPIDSVRNEKGEFVIPPLDLPARAQELKELKWGMFVCWSLSTFSEKEWTPGVKDVSFFRATSVDTDQWAKTAREAGMNYILFLAKHHDGFCLWDTQTTDRKVTKAPLGRDVLAELRESCSKYGLSLALCFSEGDWTWPGAKDGEGGGSGQNAEMERAQLTELLTKYGPIEYLWVDHAAGTGGLSHQELLAHCKKLQPSCFVGFNHGDQQNTSIRIGELGKPGPLSDLASAGPYANKEGSKNYLVAEFTYPLQPRRPKGAMWFYSHPDNEDACLLPEKIHSDYLGAVKYGNLFSINVGPDYQGKLRAIDVKTLSAVGTMIGHPAWYKHLPLKDNALSSGKPAKASSVWSAEFEAAKAFDDAAYTTRWAAQGVPTNAWLEVDLEKDQTVGRFEIYESTAARTELFVIEGHSGDGVWKEFAKGTTIGEKKVIELAVPVTARHVRLNILKAKSTPTIDEFRVLSPVGK
ncbi:MAG: alpha-L-fucosidase [bacterium]